MSTQHNIAAAAAHELPTEALLMQLSGGAFISQAVSVAAKLGLADLLKERPKQVSELAAETRMHERSLYRLLRCLASVGVFAEIDPQVFGLTPLAEPLRTDAPNSVRDLVIFMGEPWHWRVYGEMLYSVETGQSAWGRVNDGDVFDYFGKHPAESEIFNRAMTNLSRLAIPVVVEAYDFKGIGTLADIAGGHGLLLSGILKANPDLKGWLFDLPQVLEGATAMLEQEGVAERVELRRGSFFESVPAGADAYLMKHIIHDWDDERSLTILRNIHRAMPEHGKLLLVEMVIAPGNEPHFGKVQDLEMLVSPGGIERTADEYRELYKQAGFELTRIIQTASPLSIIEGVKARR
ncbi:MAG: methyltransferase [Acidobacteria bacterium]|nr:methyltransferase [Acidobacteriota bacterium]